AIRRPVVTDDDLEIAERLVQRAVDGARNPGLGVVRRHDHAHGRRAPAAAPEGMRMPPAVPRRRPFHRPRAIKPAANRPSRWRDATIQNRLRQVLTGRGPTVSVQAANGSSRPRPIHSAASSAWRYPASLARL